MGLIAAMPADSRCHTGIVIGGLGGIRSREPVAVFTGYNVSRRYPLVLSGTQAVGFRGGFEPPADRNASYRSDQLSYRSHWRADWHRRFGRRRRSTLDPCNVGRYTKTQPSGLVFFDTSATAIIGYSDNFVKPLRRSRVGTRRNRRGPEGWRAACLG